MTRKRKRFLSEMLAMAAVAAVVGGIVLGCADNGIGGAFGEIKAAKGGGSGGGNGGVTPTPDSIKILYDSRDEKTYNAVKIGKQWWMAKNLNYKSGNSWCYDDKDTNCNTYGRLYDWNAAMGGASSSNKNPSGVQGVCPVGWHLPSSAEWDALMTAVGGSSTAGKKLKSKSGWNSYISGGQTYSGNGTDEYGFSALPGGYRYSAGYFGHVGTTAAGGRPRRAMRTTPTTGTCTTSSTTCTRSSTTRVTGGRFVVLGTEAGSGGRVAPSASRRC